MEGSFRRRQTNHRIRDDRTPNPSRREGSFLLQDQRSRPSQRDGHQHHLERGWQSNRPEVFTGVSKKDGGECLFSTYVSSIFKHKLQSEKKWKKKWLGDEIKFEADKEEDTSYSFDEKPKKKQPKEEAIFSLKPDKSKGWTPESGDLLDRERPDCDFLDDTKIANGEDKTFRYVDDTKVGQMTEDDDLPRCP